PTEKAVAEKTNAELDKEIADLTKLVDVRKKQEAPQSVVDAFQRRLSEAKAKRRTWENWQVVYDVGPPTPTRVLKRGQFNAPGDEVAAGFPGVLCASDAATRVPQPAADAPTSGRRLALARWLNDDKTPAGALVLRVRVNRIWQHLFGRGIVETSDNFGVTGAEPTHPELLEWLASEFDAGGRRLKPLIRLRVAS